MFDRNSNAVGSGLAHSQKAAYEKAETGPVPAPAPQLELVAKRLSDVQDRVRSARMGLEETADRLLGSMPAVASAQGENPLRGGSGSLGVVQDLLDDVMGELSRLNEVRTRLGML